jgi:hypothetical protein
MVTEPCNARNISYNAWHRQVVAQQEVQLPLAEGQSWLGAKFVPSVRAQVVGADRSGQPLLSAELRHQLLVLGAGLLPAADDDAAGSSSDRDIFQQAEFFRRCGFVRLPKLVWHSRLPVLGGRRSARGRRVLTISGTRRSACLTSLSMVLAGR